MNTLRVILDKQGRVAVDIELPPGQECDAADAELRTILEILGAGFEDVVENPNAPRQPNGVPEGGKLKQGG
ncbi:MAG: hypothetical protein WC641_08075 [Patescibacteria group bacterium]